MGCIFRARDNRLDKTVAVKMMFSGDSTGDTQERADLFRREAQLLSTLHHRGLPKVTDFFVEWNQETERHEYYIVMSFIEGSDLESIMETRQNIPMPVEEAVDYFRQILEILKYLHSHNPPVIYKDFKAPNLMISKGKVYLIDFGIARLLEDKRENVMTGTPGYSPPEQYSGITDQRSDLYSLGVLMHYLLTGRNPQDPKHLHFEFPPISNLNKEVPVNIAAIIAQMLQRSPEKRPASAEEIIRFLDGNIQSDQSETGVKASGDRRNIYMSEVEKRTIDSARKKLIGVIIVCLILILVRAATVNSFIFLRFDLSEIFFLALMWAGIYAVFYFKTRPKGYTLKSELEKLQRYREALLSPEVAAMRYLFFVIAGLILISIVYFECSK